MVEITPEQLEALAQSDYGRLRLFDPKTSKRYLIVEEADTAGLAAKDQFLSDTAVFDGEMPADLSANHDKYLHGNESSSSAIPPA